MSIFVFLCYVAICDWSVDAGNNIDYRLKDFMPCYFIVELREWILSFIEYIRLFLNI